MEKEVNKTKEEYKKNLKRFSGKKSQQNQKTQRNMKWKKMKFYY